MWQSCVLLQITLLQTLQHYEKNKLDSNLFLFANGRYGCPGRLPFVQTQMQLPALVII